MPITTYTFLLMMMGQCPSNATCVIPVYSQDQCLSECWDDCRLPTGETDYHCFSKCIRLRCDEE